MIHIFETLGIFLLVAEEEEGANHVGIGNHVVVESVVVEEGHAELIIL